MSKSEKPSAKADTSNLTPLKTSFKIVIRTSLLNSPSLLASSLLFYTCPVLSSANNFVSTVWTKLPVTPYLKPTFFTYHYAC